MTPFRAGRPGCFFRFLFLCACALGAASAAEDPLKELESLLEGLRSEPPRASAKVRQESLGVLRKPFLSAEQYASLTRLPPAGPEALYRLARHAYLLGRREDARSWIANIPDKPAAAPWKVRGKYLLGLLALQEGKEKEAGARFAEAAETAEADVRAAALMALARLSFDSGDYRRANDLYRKIPNRSFLYEDSLAESAWAEVRLDRPDLAAADVDLLFSLFPQSTRLPEAGYLLGRIRGERKGAVAEPGVLRELLFRFEFEEAAARRALQTYAGKEEEFLYELSPALGAEPPRAILPPIARTLLGNHPLVRHYLAELTELEAEMRDLRLGRAAAEASRRVLQGPGGMTVEGVTLLARANDLEASLLGAAAETSAAGRKVAEIEKTVAALRRENRKSRERLAEIDRHIWINWKSLVGHREAEALALKKRLWADIRETLQRDEVLAELEKKLQAETVRSARAGAQAGAALLRPARAQRPDLAQSFERLDRIRDGAIAAEAARSRRWLAESEALRSETERELGALRGLKAALLEQARADIRQVLSGNRAELAATLSRYRWNVGEAEYRLLRRMDDRISEVRLGSAKELSLMEARMEKLGRRPPIPPFSPPARAGGDLAGRAADAEHFVRAAQRFRSEVDEWVDRRVRGERSRYEEYAESREAELTDARETQRERTLTAYRQVVRHDPTGPRTPFALYRIAQLQYEREDASARAMERVPRKEPVPPMNLTPAIAALERIRAEFPGFPYRDSALYLLGHVLLQSGEKARSAAAFEQLIAEAPGSRLAAEVRLRIGEHYFGERRFEEAIPHYQSVLSAGFNYFYDKALYKLAWANYLLRRYDSAIAHFLILLDYSEELAAGKGGGRFADFAEEAVEYVAFSMYRSEGRAAAERVFGRTGWKPYSLAVVKRMAEIQADRGSPREALESYDLAASRYPLTPLLPEMLEARMRILELAGENRRAVSEKERAAEMLGEASPWRKANRSDPKALARADHLLERTLLSLATEYDALAAREPERAAAAVSLYEKVLRLYPAGRPAYDAAFRLAERHFADGAYADAARRYDETVRNAAFSDRFADALYGIVASRERAAAARGAEEASGRMDEGARRDMESLSRAIDNFVRRAPRDPRAPKVMYRGAAVLAKAGNHAAAREKFSALAASYPRSEWSEQALLAAVDTYVTEKKWADAARLSEELLAKKPPLSDESRGKLKELQESSRFRAAAEAADPAEEIAGYFRFQEAFPASEHAPRALFNAFAVAKKGNHYAESEKALTLLIAKYPASAEAAQAHYELAVVYDATFDLENAAREYRKVLSAGGPETLYRISVHNLAEITAADPAARNRAETLLELSEKLPEADRARWELRAGELAEDDGHFQRALSVFLSLAGRKSAPPASRSVAASQAARICWNLGNDARARALEEEAAKSLRKLERDEQPAAQVAFAEAREAHVRAERQKIAAIRLTSKSLQALAAGFKQKATLLAQLEQSAGEALKLKSLRASASVLYELGLAYREFVASLKSLPVPEEEREDFKKSIANLTTPLETKASQALRNAHEILSKNGLPEPYFASLADELGALGVSVPPQAKESPVWIEPYLPDPPPFLEVAGAAPPAPAAGFRALLLAAATQPSADAEEELKRGIAAVESIWSDAQRARAAEAFRNAMFLRPNYAAAIFDLAVLNAFGGKEEEALRAIASLRGKIGDAHLELLEAKLAVLNRRPDRAAALLESLLEADPRNEQARRDLVLGDLFLGRKEKALARARAFLKELPDSVLAHRALAQALRERGDRSAARLLLERARAKAPDDPAVAHELALTLDRPRDLLLRSTLLAATEKSFHPEFLANRARLAFEVRDYEGACKTWEEAARAGGKFHPDIVKNLGLCEPPREGGQ